MSPALSIVLSNPGIKTLPTHRASVNRDLMWVPNRWEWWGVGAFYELGCSCFTFGSILWFNAIAQMNCTNLFSSLFSSLFLSLSPIFPLRFKTALISLWVDSCLVSCCQLLINTDLQSSRVKHIDNRHHQCREQIELGTVVYEYCASSSNLADCLTKPLSRAPLAAHIASMGLGPVLWIANALLSCIFWCAFFFGLFALILRLCWSSICVCFVSGFFCTSFFCASLHLECLCLWFFFLVHSGLRSIFYFFSLLLTSSALCLHLRLARVSLPLIFSGFSPMQLCWNALCFSGLVFFLGGFLFPPPFLFWLPALVCSLACFLFHANLLQTDLLSFLLRFPFFVALSLPPFKVESGLGESSGLLWLFHDVAAVWHKIRTHLGGFLHYICFL